MANTVFLFNSESPAMRRKLAALRNLKDSIEVLTSERNVELQRRGDTDGSQATHYAALTTAASFAQGDLASANAAAKASFEAFDDLWFKLTTNGSITDMFNAINNCCAKHGV